MILGWHKIITFLLLLVVGIDIASASSDRVLCTQPDGQSRIETAWQSDLCHSELRSTEQPEEADSLDAASCRDTLLGASASVFPPAKRDGLVLDDVVLPSVLLHWLTLDPGVTNLPACWLISTVAVDPGRCTRAAISSVVLLI